MGQDDEKREPWNVPLPRLDEDVSDPKIHVKQYKVLHEGAVLLCKKGDSCTCRIGAYPDLKRQCMCENSYPIPHEKAFLAWIRYPAALLVALVGYKCYTWWSHVPPKHSLKYSFSNNDSVE